MDGFWRSCFTPALLSLLWLARPIRDKFAKWPKAKYTLSNPLSGSFIMTMLPPNLEPSQLKAILKDAGWSNIAVRGHMRIATQILRRRDLLEDITSKYLHADKTQIFKGRIKPLTDETVARLCDEYEYVLKYCDLLDINNTIDHNPKPHTKGPVLFTKETISQGAHLNLWFDKDQLKSWNEYFKNRKRADLEDEYLKGKPPAKKDEIWRFVYKMTYAKRQSDYRARINYECIKAVQDGWFLVFDTLTLAPSDIHRFSEDENPIRDYCRKIGRLVRRAEMNAVWSDLSAKERIDISGCYRYFCVPEFGSKNGRLHFHVLHFMKTLPLGSADPNGNPIYRRGISIRNRRMLESMRGHWSYGFSNPVTCRYSGDAFSKAGYLWPTDSNGVPVPNKPVVAVARYITKYVTKSLDYKESSKEGSPLFSKHNEDAKKWLSTMKLQGLPEVSYRIRMSRGFGVLRESMESLSLEAVRQLTQLPQRTANFNSLVKKRAQKELCRRLGLQSLAAVMDARPEAMDLMQALRDSTQITEVSNLVSFILALRPSLRQEDISNEVFLWLKDNSLEWTDPQKVSFGSCK